MSTPNFQRLIRDRHLTPDEAERYRKLREEAGRDADSILAELKSSSPVFLSWEELAEFRALVKSLHAAREAKGLSREDVARIAGLEPQ